MPRILLVACVVLAVGACGTRRNPDFCCSDEASCRASGTDVEVVTCADPLAPVCDDDGAVGAPRTCIADPMSSECESPANCTNPARPFCIGNHCVECEDGATCTNPTPACSGDTHLCGPCQGPSDCTGDPGGGQCVAGACVACESSSQCTAAGAPICELSDHTCRGCRADSECASAVCDRTAGACAPEADVLYVAAGGTGTTCTQAAPCGTVNAALALAGAQRTIKIGPGTFAESLIVTGSRTVRFHGAGARTAGGTTISAAAVNTDVFRITAGATVTIDDLVVTGASGPTLPHGVRCEAGSTLTLRRTIVDANPGGGVGITSCSFELVNNIISRNGGPTSLFGGVSLSNLTGSTSVRFDFNTVANNDAPAGNVAGVACASINVPVPIQNSIVFGNDVAGALEIGTDNDCVATRSVIGDASPGPTNDGRDPLFVSASDFHLRPTSPAVSGADPAATLAHDLDGDPRPQGPGREPGADELTP